MALLRRTVQFATSVLLITAAQTGLCWHRLKHSHSKYEKLHSLALITPSDKHDSTFLHSEPRRRGNTCTCRCHYETHISENIPFPLVRDSNWFVVCWRRCLKKKKGDISGAGGTGVGEETFVWAFVWKSEGEGLLGKSRHRVENNIKVAFKNWNGWTRTGLNWLSTDQWPAVVNTDMNLRVPKNVGNLLTGCGTVRFSAAWS
jgi:hypothetical protein